jgi:hypothetical protein
VLIVPKGAIAIARPSEGASGEARGISAGRIPVKSADLFLRIFYHHFFTGKRSFCVTFRGNNCCQLLRGIIPSQAPPIFAKTARDGLANF